MCKSFMQETRAQGLTLRSAIGQYGGGSFLSERVDVTMLILSIERLLKNELFG